MVFEAFRDLFVVDDQDTGYKEDDAEEYPEEEKSSECANKISAFSVAAETVISEKVRIIEFRADILTDLLSHFHLSVAVKICVKVIVPYPHEHRISVAVGIFRKICNRFIKIIYDQYEG